MIAHRAIWRLDYASQGVVRGIEQGLLDDAKIRPYLPQLLTSSSHHSHMAL